MNKAIAKVAALMDRPWRRLEVRDRRMLILLAAVLLAVLLWQALWQPAQLRLEVAERRYQQQWELAQAIGAATPLGMRAQTPVRLAQVSEAVAAAGLELEQLDVEAGVLRLTLRGEALALLTWLEGMERGGAILQNLALEKSATQLEARVALRLP